MPISENDLRLSFLQYITARSTESDRAHFEERLLADQEFSDAAAACEQELIDAYALQQLSAEEMGALKLWIESSSHRMQRVKMAQALLLARRQRTRSKQRIAVVLAAAACVLVAVTLRLTNRTMQRDSKTVSQTLATNAGPSQSATPPSAAVSSETKPDVILLAAERVRGEEQIVTYHVHRHAPVQLQILLTGETARSGYRLQVAPLEGGRDTLFEQTDLKAQSMDGQLYLKVTLPPGTLPPATYAASVSRRGDIVVAQFTLKWAQE